MDSQVVYSRGDEYEKAPPTVGLHKDVGRENEELSPSPSPSPSPPQQGKKSVLKKVKDKAKKIKDTLTKQSNSHGHGNGSGDQVPNDLDLNEEDDADEEMEELDQRPELPINKYGSDQEVVGKVKLSEQVTLEESPNAPVDPADQDRKPTDQVEVTDPAGQGSLEETGVDPLIRSFEKINVETDPEPELQQSHNFKHPKPAVLDPTGDESSMPPGKMDTRDHPGKQSSYTEKISTAASAITYRAISAKNMVASKLGYGEKDDQAESQDENSASSGGYGNKFSVSASAIAEKAVSAKNVVSSKLGYGEKDNEAEENSTSTDESGSKFSAATSAIADKAVTAKNVIASKLGYGEKEPEKETPESERVKETFSSPGEYGKKVATTVYEKVAGAGATAASKIRGITVGAEKEGAPAEGENRVVSVKDYLAEKLKPGEEDKALSEIISGALHKNKEENDPSEVDPPSGKVTESEEVRKRLGEEGEGGGSGSGSGKAMAGKIKETIGYWMGRTGSDHQVSPPANPSSQRVEDMANSGRRESLMEEKDGEERRVLQESTY